MYKNKSVSKFAWHALNAFNERLLFIYWPVRKTRLFQDHFLCAPIMRK